MTRLVNPALILSLLPACASTPAVEPNPWTADQIVRLLRGAVSPERVLHDAERDCISFDVTPDVAQQLVAAGATPEFVSALAAVCRLTRPSTVPSPGN